MLNSTTQAYWHTPLHYQWAAVPEQTGHAALQLSSGGAVGILNLRGLLGDATFVAAIDSALGVALPTTPKQSVYAQDAAIFWLSPDEWLLVCAYAKKNEVLARLQAACKGVFAQVVDNSGGFMAMQIQGSEAKTFLRHLSPYNVSALEDSQVVSTVLKKTTVVIHKVGANDYVLLFRRSFADYLWRIFEKTAKPYGMGVSQNWHCRQADWQRYTA